MAQGSTFGRTQFGLSAFDYGASDIQYPSLELPVPRCNGKPFDDRCFVYVPVSAGGLAFMYNLTDGSGNRIDNLKLTRADVCKIFTGAITKWDDPEIVANNPQLASYDHNIRPIVRSDGAGESYVLSEFCIAVQPKVWQAFVTAQNNGGDQQGSNLPDFKAGQPTSQWPRDGWGTNPVPVATADGTANYVADPVGGPDTITYVAAGYAKVRSFPTASVQNAAGVFTQPDETNVTVALAYATGRPNGTFQLAFNGPDPRAYFPSTYSYVLAQTTGFDPAKGATLGQFLCYAVSKGQVIAPQLRYARLSSELVNIAISAIVKIPGAPSTANCPVAGAPAPPPPVQLCATCGAGATSSGGPGSPNGGTGSPSPSNNSAAGVGTAKANRAGGGNATSSMSSTRSTANARNGGRDRAGGFESGPATTAESLDAKLASAAARVPTQSGGAPASVWLLLAGACVTFAATTVWSRRRPTT